MLKGPAAKRPLFDHALECESALEPFIVKLMNEAIDAGWTVSRLSP